MNAEHRTLKLLLASINRNLRNDPRNSQLIVEKIRILRELSKFQKIELEKFKSLDFKLPEFDDCFSTCFYHAWIRILDERSLPNNFNFHVSVMENQVVKIDCISYTFSEMNPISFHYIGVVFGLGENSRHLISEQQKTKLIQRVQTKYGHWFHFPEAVDPFIMRSLVGIEECCPICLTNEDLETCVAVRDGKCDHAFHRDCIKSWFAQCGERQCPYCKQYHDAK